VGDELLPAIVAEPQEAPSAGDSAGALRRPRGAAARRPTGRRASRILAAGLACLALGGTALAATGVWDPPIGVNTGAAPPTRSYSPVPGAIANVLGILRREQTPRDRSLEVEATLSKALFADGIRPGSVRSLSASEAEGEATVLFSAERSASQFAPSSEQICLYHPAFVVSIGEVPACFSLPTLLAGHADQTYEIFSPKLLEELESGPEAAVLAECQEDPPPPFCLPLRGTVVGLVPDGVATVTAALSGAPNVTVPVHENYFEIPLHGAELTHRPTGLRHTVWHSADGQVVPQRPIEP
jgi:hypothetical protein